MCLKYIKIFFSILIIVAAHSDSCEKEETFQCGRRPNNLYSDLITSGAGTKASDWPWFAMVVEKDSQNNNKNIYIYDAIIISSNALLTCGYCVFRNKTRIPLTRLSVQVGTSNYNAVNEIGRKFLPVVKVLTHPGFDIEKSRATSNLALLFVNKLVFTEHVQPICVWGPLYDKTDLYGQQAVVASFASSGTSTDRLQPLYSVVQSDETCVAYVPGHSSWLNEFNFCAGDVSGTSPDSARGGTGLALPVTQDDNPVTWFLHGIFSHCGGDSKGECDLKSLKLYTNVAPHYPWIYHNVFNN
ncbi:transmembrane protease serine 11A-like [Aricia agestis]|uniref:transmembrane protease serine 11A-like n=1 Tax=Aricia agestis TaxID=91739 RepID=UPI001C20A19E|nr:transmembrane protease serine 11A-like [Aricia agestis]